MEIPLPRNIDTHKRVRTRQAKPLSDEAKYVFGSSLIVYKVGQESYGNFQEEKETMFTQLYDRATKCSLWLWREEEAFPSLNI